MRPISTLFAIVMVAGGLCVAACDIIERVKPEVWYSHRRALDLIYNLGFIAFSGGAVALFILERNTLASDIWEVPQ